MHLRSCVITLLVVYPVFLTAGFLFYRYLQKTKPSPLPPGHPRARFVKPWRFVMFVILLPLAAMLSFAVFGWLDPLFHAIQHWRFS